MSAAIERQSANQVNQLFPNCLNWQLSSENPVLVYKKRKNKLAHNSQSSWWSSDTAVELCWLISLYLCHSKLPTRCPSSAGEQICPTPALLQPSPLPCFCLLSLWSWGCPAWHFLSGGRSYQGQLWAVQACLSSPCSYLVLLFNKPSEPKNKTSLETKT